MKTAALPSVRVEPEFREELEASLSPGETVSAFIENSVRNALHKRQLDAKFHARAKTSIERFKSGEEQGYTVEEVVAELRAMNEGARAELKKHGRTDRDR